MSDVLTAEQIAEIEARQRRFAVLDVTCLLRDRAALTAALARCVAALEGVIEIQRRHPGDTPLRMVDCARDALTSPEVVALAAKGGTQ